jgi:hypothetical protein
MPLSDTIKNIQKNAFEYFPPPLIIKLFEILQEKFPRAM